jgi:hypothetical protein
MSQPKKYYHSVTFTTPVTLILPEANHRPPFVVICQVCFQGALRRSCHVCQGTRRVAVPVSELLPSSEWEDVEWRPLSV